MRKKFWTNLNNLTDEANEFNLTMFRLKPMFVIQNRFTDLHFKANDIQSYANEFVVLNTSRWHENASSIITVTTKKLPTQSLWNFSLP